DRLELRDELRRGDFRTARHGASGQDGAEQLRQRDVLAQLRLDRRDEMRDAGELALVEQLRPAHAAGDRDAREVVALEVDDHHMLRGVLRRLDVLAQWPRALDRGLPNRSSALLEQELRRRGDDRPAVAL